MGTIYLMDTNLFIEAKNTWYAFDIIPSFWTGLQKLSKDGTIKLIDRVYDELNRKDDELAQWIRDNWLSKHEDSKRPEIIAAYAKIIIYIDQLNQFSSLAKEDFASKADSWLIAHALSNVNVNTVVTRETFDNNCRKKVKIPNVCQKFNIPCIDIHEFMRKTNFRI